MATKNPRVVDIRFEHHHDGLGLGIRDPRISWSFADNETRVTNWQQRAYEIELVHFDETAVSNRNEPSRIRVITKVRVRVAGEELPADLSALDTTHDTSGNVDGADLNDESKWSDWSIWASVETALLHESDWVAQFIEPSASLPKHAEDGSFIPIQFNAPEFKVPLALHSSSTKGRLYVTAHGVYQVYINGRAVGDQCLAPGWTSYKHRLQYQTYDVSDLVSGVDAIHLEIHVGAGWFASAIGWEGGRRDRFGDALGVLAQLHIDSDLGDARSVQSLVLATDSSWTSAPTAIAQSELYNGETFDARNISLGSASNGLPVIVKPLPSAQLISPEAPPVRVTQEVKITDILTTPSGKTVLDFGQNLVGRLRINHLQKPKGHRIQFAHAEVLERGELGRRPLRTAACTDTVISDGKLLEKWSPLFTFHGFRFVEVDGWSPDDVENPLTKDSVTALVMHTDMKRTGWFTSSHELLNKLHENAIWSMRGNFLSIPTDCPQRDERLGWTGDIQAFSPSANFLYDTCSMLGGWIQDVAAEQKASGDGVPPFVVPDVITFDEGVDDDRWWPHLPNAVWDDVTVILPWNLHHSFGDPAILTRQYESMQDWINRGVVRGGDGLWDPDIWQLGDWLDPIAPPSEPGNGKTNNVLVADAFLVRITTIMVNTCRTLGLETEADRYASDQETLSLAFQDKYITPGGLLASDSQTAYALAFTNNLFSSPEQQGLAVKNLIRSVSQAQFRVATGFAGTPIILHALSQIAKPQYAYRMLLEKQCPSWMYPVLMGATTLWERWDSMLSDGSINPGQMTSFNHYAFGSVVSWMHEVMGGISALSPGWKRILVRPVPGATLTHCHVRHLSPYGEIDSRWELNGTKFALVLSVPPNCVAYVVLPDRQKRTVLETDDDGVWVGSGEHVFNCSWEGWDDEWPLKAPRPPFWPQPTPSAA